LRTFLHGFLPFPVVLLLDRLVLLVSLVLFLLLLQLLQAKDPIFLVLNLLVLLKGEALLRFLLAV